MRLGKPYEKSIQYLHDEGLEAEWASMALNVI